MTVLATYTLADFPEQAAEPQAEQPIAAKAVLPSRVIVLDLGELPSAVPPHIRQLIETGDDSGHPRSSPTPKYRSRSEAVFAAACGLARAKCSDAQIAGILINPAHEISASVLEKRQARAYALRQARKAIAVVESGWPDIDRALRARATFQNTILALRRMNLRLAYDQFRHRRMISGIGVSDDGGEVSDEHVVMLRSMIIDDFGFDPGSENVRDAISLLCSEHAFHPITTMLDALTWDGIPRLDDWLSAYLGAEATPLNQAIGRLMLIGAVRRVREPGVKFDTIVVLEGKQGSGKSSALRIIAGPGAHSDNEILSLDTKAQMEAMEGVWLYELGEISGLRKTEVERVKAFASRQEDRARLAYGRFSEARPRQAIFIGTTNETRYLRDETGNRRFLPVRTGAIDLAALQRDRDQLLAEAAQRETAGESITLPEELWAAAGAEQDERLEEDPWLDALSNVNGTAFGDEVRLFTAEVLHRWLGLETNQQHGGHAKRAGAALRRLGWEHAKFKIEGKTVRGFRRPKLENHVDDYPLPKI